MVIDVKWSSRTSVQLKKRKGEKDEFTAGISQITTCARVFHTQQAAHTCPFEICPSTGWLPLMAHRQATTL